MSWRKANGESAFFLSSFFLLSRIALAFMDGVFFLPPMAVVASVLVLVMSKDAEEIGGTVILSN